MTLGFLTQGFLANHMPKLPQFIANLLLPTFTTIYQLDALLKQKNTKPD